LAVATGFAISIVKMMSPVFGIRLPRRSLGGGGSFRKPVPRKIDVGSIEFGD
jgi:hypothetical protein